MHEFLSNFDFYRGLCLEDEASAIHLAAQYLEGLCRVRAVAGENTNLSEEEKIELHCPEIVPAGHVFVQFGIRKGDREKTNFMRTVDQMTALRKSGLL